MAKKEDRGVLGWAKTVGSMAKALYRGIKRVGTLYPRDGDLQSREAAETTLAA